MIKLNGDAKLDDLTEKDLRTLGIENIQTISENSFTPKVTFRYSDGRLDIVEIKEGEDMFTKIDEKLNSIIKNVPILYRKEKLNELRNRN